MSGRFNWSDAMLDRLRTLAAEGFSNAEMADAFGLSRSAVAGVRFRNQLPSGRQPYFVRKPPTDFVGLAPTLTVKALAMHYGASPQTVRGWLDLLELEPAKRVYAKKEKPAKPATIKPVRYVRNPGLVQQFKIPTRDATLAASAQLYLQRYFPVFRASTIDPSAPNGLWIIAGRRASEEDLVRTAVRKGFQLQAMAA